VRRLGARLLQSDFPVTAPSTKPHAVGAKPLATVPLLDLQRQFEQIRAEVLAAVGRVCASQQYILGSEVESFERDLADFCGAKEGVGCASGTDAVWLALVTAGVQPGDHVLTTPFSFFASASAIARIGARPVFADINAATFNLDPTQVEAHLRRSGYRKLRALLPVHLYGQCADMDRFQVLASEFHLAVVEDAAQAIGAAWRDRRAGSAGVAAAFSFYPTKNLSAYGEAGLVTTNDPELAAHMRRLRNHGSSRRYVHVELGWNSRLDAIQAAILHVKLKYVEGWNQARRQRAAVYDKLFAESGLAAGRQSHSHVAKPGSAPGSVPHATFNHQQSTISASSPLQLPRTFPQAHHVFHQYVIRAHRRDELREFLIARQIGCEIYYPIPLHLQPCFVYLGYREGDFPEAERAAKEVLALPMFPELTEVEQRWVVASVAEFYG
jgi:dTDP-4-amino-4,6-dideoxygalactose transaminase